MLHSKLRFARETSYHEREADGDGLDALHYPQDAKTDDLDDCEDVNTV